MAKPNRKSDETQQRAGIAKKALLALRKNHDEEYEGIYTQMCEEAGIPPRRRLVGEAAKRAKAEALAAELGLALVPLSVSAEAQPTDI